MKIRSIVHCGLFAALLSLCAWLSIPISGYRFSLQTLGVFLALGLLGGKRGTVAIGVYLLLGMAGLPVFAGFRGGVAPLLEPTGGYLWGFFLSGLVYWMCRRWGGKQGTCLLLSLLVCYAAGTLWFAFGYGQGMAVQTIVLTCVAPYCLPDGAKLLLALWLIKRLKPYV